MKPKALLIPSLLFFTFYFLLFTLSGQTTDPILSLNSPMHSATINRISTDAGGKYLLTASDDKTAKLWDAATGELIQTYRPPIGQGDEGMLYACALSPDGNIAAVGGWSSTNDIYLFNTNTGELIQRLAGLGNVILDLEFSPDGSYLAAALGGSSGVVIFKKMQSEFTKHLSLTGYANSSYNTTFDKNGRLATVCDDGKIRLYDQAFNLIDETTGAGNRPFSIAFSPDGSKLAVGYVDSPFIEVFSAKNLKLLFKPELGEMNENGGFNKLAFSADGNYLCGGGGYSKKIDGQWWRVVRRWAKTGTGSFTDFPAGGNTIMDIKALPAEGMLIGGSQPDLCRMDALGNKIFYRAGELNSYRAKDRSHFKVNNDGSKLAFTPYLKKPMLFSVDSRQLTETQNTNGLEAFTDQKSGCTVSNWQITYAPKINGKEITYLSQYERCRSTDISPMGDKIILGTSYNIYCADKAGNKLWKTPVQGEAWVVNISGNGKVVVAALSGGLINWYRMSDGQLLLSLFAHPDNKRWVLYTPDGYYDASPGAEGLFGWHLNNGPDKAAYFFPASKFRDKYYRPDIIDNILITLDQDEAVRIADLAGNRKSNTSSIANRLPPVVNIIKPAHNQEVSSTTLTLEFTALSPGGEPITQVKFMIDGRPVENQRGFKPIGASNTGQKIITIPKQDVTLQVLAENQHGWSVASEVRIKWKGMAEVDLYKPTLYVLSIGVSDYQNSEYNLKYAAKDARDFAATIKAQKGGLYKDVVVKTLTDHTATKNNILDGLDWLQRETTARDMAMIFIAGHGMNDNMNTFYYLPYEADINSLRRTGLMFTELKYTTSAIAGKVVAFVDACHSGNVMGGRRAPDVNNLVNELSDVESGAVVFTSSTGKQFSLEDDTWGNGAFTKALIEGLNGKADYSHQDKITIKSLDFYIAERVKTLTKGQQTPTVVIPESMSDFPIGIVR
jgi:WD40 repeat protein